MQVRIIIKGIPVDYAKKLVLGKEQPKCRVWNIRFSTKGKKGGLIKQGDMTKLPMLSGDSMLPKDAIEKYRKCLIHMLNKKGSIKNERLPTLHPKTNK